MLFVLLSKIDGLPQDSNSSLFANYASQPVTAPGNFLDASSTALLASTVYRLALLRKVYTHLPMAEKCRQALSSSNSSTTLKHFTSDGFLTPVVDPDSYGMEGNQSAEGQAFVVEMQSAWRDWVAAEWKVMRMYCCLPRNGRVCGTTRVGKWSESTVIGTVEDEDTDNVNAISFSCSYVFLRT